MSLLLARKLVDQGLVDPGRMDDVLQQQVVSGGSLDTNILELGLLDEATITRALAELHKLPVADGKLLARRDPRTVNLVPSRVATKYQVVPVAVSGRVLHLLAAERLHPLVIEELSFLLALEIKTHIVCQARLMGYLRDWYQQPIEQRFELLLAKLGAYPEAPRPEKTVLPPPGRLAAQVDAGRMEEVIDRLETAEQVARARRQQARSGRFTLAQASAAIMQAEDRDQLVDHILRFARQFAEVVVLFIVAENDFLGWDSVGLADGERLKLVRLPTGAASVLSLALQTRAPYLGELAESHGNNQLLEVLQRPRPANVFVVPLQVRERVVALLYGESGRQPIRSAHLSPLLVFASRLPAAFENLIRRLKSKASEARQRSWQMAEQAARQALAATTPPGNDESATAEGGPETTPVVEEEEPVVVDESFLDGQPQEQDEPAIVKVEAQDQDKPAVGEEDAHEPAPEAAEVPLDGQHQERQDHEEAPEPVPEPAEAAAAATGGQLAEQPPAPPPAMPQPVQSRPAIPLPDPETLYQQLIGANPERASLASDALATLGREALPVLMKHFPGRLDFKVRSSYDHMPPLREHGPLLACLLDMGPAAMPALVERLEDEDPLCRYYAIRLLQEYGLPQVVPRLAQRLADSETLVRLAALDALEHFRGTDEFSQLLEKLRGQLREPDPSRQAVAAALLGNFRDTEAVASLARMVKGGNRMVCRAARQALSYITKQDFGSNPRKWLKWWNANKGKNRIEWLIEGLLSNNRDIRFSSAQELTQLTGQYFDYVYDSNKQERARAAQKWRQWWETRGRLMKFDSWGRPRSNDRG